MRKGLKIAFVCPNDFTVVTFCGELVRRLQDDNRNIVYAVCAYHGSHGENTQEHYASVMKSWGVVHIPVTYYRFLSIRRDLRYFAALCAILRREHFDLVINISTKPNIYGAIAARLAGTPRIVCSVWGLGVAFSEGVGLKGALLKSAILALYRIAFRVSHRIWFTNEDDYNLFVSARIARRDRAFLTKFFVNTDVYSPDSVNADQAAQLRQEFGLTDENRVVVMVARMSWAKGVREFVEAAGILRERWPLVKFILVGPRDDGSPDSVPESYLRENERYGNFKWTGFRKDVQTFYFISDLAVLPSYYREGGYPKGLTEAMAMGKPIVTTDSVHCRGTVEDGKNGYQVPIKDSGALAGAIEKIIADDDRRVRFGRYSRAKALSELDERTIAAEVVREML